MSGIAGMEGPNKRDVVLRMLNRMGHRGPAGRAVLEFEAATLGVVWTEGQAASSVSRSEAVVRDSAGEEHLSEARIDNGHISLTRDRLGVAPLYYGHTRSGELCFASEVKAMLEVSSDVHAFPPGHRHENGLIKPYFQLKKQVPRDQTWEKAADGLRTCLEASVVKRAGGNEMGSWLSGGLDSSTLAALGRRQLGKLHTFAAGVEGAPDLEYAREVASFIDSRHHEVLVDLDRMLAALPRVIYHLESFDALLVRSSITNYLVAELASDHVCAVFSGEGGDELFAGYEYLKSIEPVELPDELIDIIGRLHNTALQRVDRCSSAHGTVAHVGFLDPEVVDYALRIPAGYKINQGIEKWILRRAMEGVLPEAVLNRPKAKFWEGAGVGELLAQYAEEKIKDEEFTRERDLPNGWVLNTKEELMYYRIFREHFGPVIQLDWMGRSKGAPQA